jgi:hypothetical protein
MMKRDFPPIHPGEILLEDFLKPMQISQYYLAQAVGGYPHVALMKSSMANGVSPRIPPYQPH